MAILRPATFNPGQPRIAITGLTFSGKTVWALEIAKILAKTTTLIDADNGESEAYADDFKFSIIEIEKIQTGKREKEDEQLYRPARFIKAIREAIRSKAGAVIVDPYTKAWSGRGGVLQIKDKAESTAKNSGWRVATPQHDDLLDEILCYPGASIVTMRAKDKLLIQKDDKTGKTTFETLPLMPIQRPKIIYEFPMYAEIDEIDHRLYFVKVKGRFTAAAALLREEGFKDGKELKPFLLNYFKKGK